MADPHDPGPQDDDILGPCAVGQVLIKLFPPIEAVFRYFAKKESFMKVFRPLKAAIGGYK